MWLNATPPVAVHLKYKTQLQFLQLYFDKTKQLLQCNALYNVKYIQFIMSNANMSECLVQRQLWNILKAHILKMLHFLIHVALILRLHSNALCDKNDNFIIFMYKTWVLLRLETPRLAKQTYNIMHLSPWEKVLRQHVFNLYFNITVA